MNVWPVGARFTDGAMTVTVTRRQFEEGSLLRVIAYSVRPDGVAYDVVLPPWALARCERLPDAT